MEPVENCSGIYLIVNSANGHSYVGSSSNVLKRVWAHLAGKKGSEIVAAAVRKHGRDCFHTFLLERAARCDLPVREAFWIAKLRPEYNASLLTETGGKIISDAQRAKLRAANLGKRLSHEHRANIRAGLLAMPPEIKAARLAKVSARIQPMTERRRRSEALKGKPWSTARRAAHDRARLPGDPE